MSRMNGLQTRPRWKSQPRQKVGVAQKKSNISQMPMFFKKFGNTKRSPEWNRKKFNGKTQSLGNKKTKELWIGCHIGGVFRNKIHQKKCEAVIHIVQKKACPLDQLWGAPSRCSKALLHPKRSQVGHRVCKQPGLAVNQRLQLGHKTWNPLKRIHWLVPRPGIPVTTRIITFVVGNPYKPSFATGTGRGNPKNTLQVSIWWFAILCLW